MCKKDPALYVFCFFVPVCVLIHNGSFQFYS